MYFVRRYGYALLTHALSYDNHVIQNTFFIRCATLNLLLASSVIHWQKESAYRSLISVLSVGDEVESTYPIIYNNSTTKILVVKEGQSIRLKCFAGGFPTPIVLWKRGKTVYRDNILSILAITKRNRGTYKCVAENILGKITQRLVNIRVEFVPVITVPHPNVTQSLHYEIDLLCIIETNPSPIITWIKDGVQVLDDFLHKTSISSFTNSKGVFFSTQQITLLRYDQFGKYICQANNFIGFAKAVINIFES